MKILVRIKNVLFSHYSVESKYYDGSNKLVVGKLKDETDSVNIKDFFGFKPKMY